MRIRRIRAVSLLGASLVALTAFAAPSGPAPDPRLQRELEQLVRGFHGKVGIYVRHLRTGRTAAIDADSLFPAPTSSARSATARPWSRPGW